MREERVVLEDHAEAPLLRRQARHVFLLDAHAAGVRLLEPRHEPQHCRLAAPRRPEKRHDLALRHGQGEVGGHVQPAEMLVQAVEDEEGFVICGL